MKRSSPRFRVPRAGLLFVSIGIWLVAGCQNVFVQKHRVLVDAIAAPGTTKPTGKSYRLVAKRSMVSNTPVQIPILKACVDAALTGHGLYEPPPNTPPEVVIEVSCGRDASSRALASVRETFLQLSARSNPQGALDKGTGPELWDVRVAVLGLSGSIETALPLLSTVAAEHMGTNTGVETRIEVPQNAPTVEAVRQTAIRALESQAQRVAAANSTSSAGQNRPAANVAPQPGAPSTQATARGEVAQPSTPAPKLETNPSPDVLREPMAPLPEPESPKPVGGAAPTASKTGTPPAPAPN